MQRRLAVVLTCALMAFGQRSRPDAPAPAAAPDPWLIDALALDAGGLPVTDLTAADFELAQGGRSRKITNGGRSRGVAARADGGGGAGTRIAGVHRRQMRQRICIEGLRMGSPEFLYTNQIKEIRFSFWFSLWLSTAAGCSMLPFAAT